MPLTRYQIRNEYGLADPELYKAADRDDPEALLEGVAMAGLVGVLRELGDLAEFAAEIFHDLHEEVMATAARGHGLMARVQQLEAEVPSFERAFLSQTDHSAFFSNAGVDWHPNLRMEQNLVTRGDLPRLVMDSYEECRGPPRLFLLDKFDVAGAGACLKRYTDPSFFKVETASSGITTAEIQRDKKIRRVKKKGRWKNGETPEVMPTSHAKLHQLFLEERVANGHSDPARLVKLKRRQLNAFPFDMKPAKSYMEKFLETSLAEHVVGPQVSITPLALKLTSDSSSESGLEVREIGTVSPMEQSLQRKENRAASSNAHEVVPKPFMNELNGDVTDREIVKIPHPSAYDETDESTSTIHKMAIEEEVEVDVDSKTEGSLGDHSDDMTSELENYVDALNTMESEMEADTEYKRQHNNGYLNVGKHGADNYTCELQQDDHGNFSDSQSVGNSSVCTDGNDSFKKGRSNFSYSDSLSNLAENTSSNGDGAAKVFSSAENSVIDIMDLPSDHPSVFVENQRTEYHEHVTCTTEEDRIPNPGEASCSPSLADSKLMLLPSAPIANSPVVTSVEHEWVETPSGPIKLGLISPNNGSSKTYLADTSEILSDVPFKTKQDDIFETSCAIHHMDELNHEDKNVLSDASVYISNVSELAPKTKGGDDLVTEMPQTDSVDACAENLVERISFPLSLSSSTGEQFFHSALPEVVDSTVASLPNSPDVVKSEGLVYEVDEAIAIKGVSLEHLTPVADNSEASHTVELQCSDVGVDVSQDALDLTDIVFPYLEGKLKDEEVVCAADCEEMSGSTSEDTARDAVLLEHPFNCSDHACLEDHRNSEDVRTESVQAEDATTSDAGGGASSVICPMPDLSFPSENLLVLNENHSGSDGPHYKKVDSDGTLTPEFPTEVEPEKEVKQLEVGSNLDSSINKSVSDELSFLEETEQVHDPSMEEQSENSPYSTDVTIALFSELCNQEESKPLSQSHSEANGEDAMYLTTHSLPGAGNSLKRSMELQAQICLEPGHAGLSTCHLPEHGFLPYQLLELQSNELDRGYLQADEANSKSSDHRQPLDGLIEQKRHLDASLEHLPSKELVSRSATKESNATNLVSHLFNAVFPSISLLPDLSPANLEEMPPMPPLPPMQWRMGKFQPAALSPLRECLDQGQNTFPQIIKPFTADEKAQYDFASSAREIMQPSNPFLPLTTADSQSLESLSAESVESSLQQPTPLLLGVPRSVTDANDQEDCLPLEATQTHNPFLTLPEVPNEHSERQCHSLEGQSTESSSNPSSALPTVEHTIFERDPVSSEQPLVAHLNHLASDSGSEAKLPEHISQSSEEKQENSPGESVVPITTVEPPQQDLVMSQGEVFPPNTLALPPTYEVGKPNGPKLPRPRNPLIDAVAAHDKSKMRKVTDMVRPQIGPKEDERDSLLEQIRTKSFNLKPAAASRLSIKGIQGPKTNLKVAAILEKANAIRQALAGSDEDDESDNWSDS